MAEVISRCGGEEKTNDDAKPTKVKRKKIFKKTLVIIWVYVYSLCTNTLKSLKSYAQKDKHNMVPSASFFKIVLWTVQFLHLKSYVLRLIEKKKTRTRKTPWLTVLNTRYSLRQVLDRMWHELVTWFNDFFILKRKACFIVPNI